MQWRRFVKLNRSELSNHTIHTAREAADFYHRCIEMAAGLVTIAAMTAAFVYESPIAACVFASAIAGKVLAWTLLAGAAWRFVRGRGPSATSPAPVPLAGVFARRPAGQ